VEALGTRCENSNRDAVPLQCGGYSPAIIPSLGYRYKNVSFQLGFGAGAMLARRKWRAFDYFPVFLALEIGPLFLCRDVVFSTSADEIRMPAFSPTMSNNLLLIAIFAVNALLFVPLGQKMGMLFDVLPRLTAAEPAHAARGSSTRTSLVAPGMHPVTRRRL
jgi:hypothetical protein